MSRKILVKIQVAVLEENVVGSDKATRIIMVLQLVFTIVVDHSFQAADAVEVADFGAEYVRVGILIRLDGPSVALKTTDFRLAARRRTMWRLRLHVLAQSLCPGAVLVPVATLP